MKDYFEYFCMSCGQCRLCLDLKKDRCGNCYAPITIKAVVGKLDVELLRKQYKERQHYRYDSQDLRGEK